MPNRMIKESIRTSRSVNALTDFQFRVWLYLITFVDDFGRGSADPELLKGLCFPRRKGLTEEQIKDALGVLASMGMIKLYDVDDEPYFYFPKWGDHQRVQTKQSKYPGPPETTEKDGALPSSTEAHGDPPSPTVNHGDPPPEVEVEVEVEVETNKNLNKNLKKNGNHAHAMDPDFEKFWDAYPKKTGDIRQACQEYLFALDDATPEQLLTAIQSQVAASSEKDLQYFPSADKWLRNRSWRNLPKGKKPPRTFVKTEFD